MNFKNMSIRKSLIVGFGTTIVVSLIIIIASLIMSNMQKNAYMDIIEHYVEANQLVSECRIDYNIAARGLRRALFSLVCIFNLPFAVYALLAWFQPQSMWLVGGGIVVEYFGYGFGFVGLTLYMMQQVAPGPYRMAHYAFASGIMNLSVMLTGMASGYLSDMLGYRTFFVAVLLATVPVFAMTRLVPFTYDEQTKKK